MYAASGFGLSEQTSLNLQQRLPDCDTRLMIECAKSRNRNEPQCAEFAYLHAAIDEDKEHTEEILGGRPFCDYTAAQRRNILLVAGAGGLAVGLLLASAIIR